MTRRAGLGRRAANASRSVVTRFVGDPAGHALADPLVANARRQINGQVGTVIAGANGDIGSPTFFGTAIGGLHVGMSATRAIVRENPLSAETARDTRTDPIRAAFAARYQRTRRT